MCHAGPGWSVVSLPQAVRDRLRSAEMRWRVREGAAIVTGLAAVVMSPHVAFAQTQEEPITVQYDAPAECPTRTAFWSEITARTTKARAAAAGEKARVLHVAIVQNVAGSGATSSTSEGFTGRLLMEETTSWSSAREVRGATCGEVVEALGLIAALALDPKASVAPRPPAAPSSSSSTPAPTTSGPVPPEKASPPQRVEPSVAPVVSSEQPLQPGGAPARASQTHVNVGGQLEGAAFAGAVFGGRLFGELEWGAPTRTLAPAVRLAIGRTLEIDRQPVVGAATLRWTQASLEGCPIRLGIVNGLALRPCAGVSGGVLEAEATGVSANRSRTRPWVSIAAQARLVWSLVSWLALEAEGGAVAPLIRETFFFAPTVTVYEAPVVALFFRAGVTVRFP